MFTLQRLPVARVKGAKVGSKIVFNEGPAFTRLGARDDAGARFFLHRNGVQIQELSGLLQVQCFHGAGRRSSFRIVLRGS